MKLKKVVAFAMAAVMTLGMVGCGSSSPGQQCCCSVAIKKDKN